MHGDGHWVQVKLEEDARSTFAMLQDPSVVSNTVLISFQGAGTRGNICCGYDMEEVLVGDEGY
jgi:hypothetical protein